MQISSNTAKAFQAIGGIVQGVGQFMNAKQEVDLGDYNAKIYEQRAEAERSSQVLLEAQKKKVIKSQIGSQIAASGSSGFNFTGSPIDIMTESYANANLDLMIDRYNSDVRAQGFLNEANLSRYEASQRARRLRTSGAGTFLSTAVDYLQSQQEIGKIGKKGRPVGVSGPLRKDGTF